MTVPTNTTLTFDSVGNREDLSDVIYMISPTETPFLMMAGRDSADATRHDWQTDKLAAAANNEQLQGDDPTLTAFTATIRLANHMQICSKAIGVSGTQEAISKAGRKSELAYQLAKRAKELKRDIEFRCVGTTMGAGGVGASRAPASGVAGRAGSVQTWFHDDEVVGGTTLAGDNTIRASDGADGGFNTSTFVTTLVTDGTQRALIETYLKQAVQAAWTNGGDPTLIMCGPYNKTVISTFSGNATRFDRSEDKRLIAAVDVYVSDFGEHRVVPNRFQRERDVFVFTPDLWSIAYLRGFRQFALAKSGDSEKRELLAEWTIVSENQAGSAIIADLLTS